MADDGKMRDADWVSEAFSQTRRPLHARALSLIKEERGDGDDASDERIAEISREKKVSGHHGAVHPVDGVYVEVHAISGALAAFYRWEILAAIHRPADFRLDAESIGEDKVKDSEKTADEYLRVQVEPLQRVDGIRIFGLIVVGHVDDPLPKRRTDCQRLVIRVIKPHFRAKRHLALHVGQMGEVDFVFFEIENVIAIKNMIRNRNID